jgi:hypothetical protein
MKVTIERTISFQGEEVTYEVTGDVVDLGDDNASIILLSLTVLEGAPMALEDLSRQDRQECEELLWFAYLEEERVEAELLEAALRAVRSRVKVAKAFGDREVGRRLTIAIKDLLTSV